MKQDIRDLDGSYGNECMSSPGSAGSKVSYLIKKMLVISNARIYKFRVAIVSQHNECRIEQDSLTYFYYIV